MFVQVLYRLMQELYAATRHHDGRDTAWDHEARYTEGGPRLKVGRSEGEDVYNVALLQLLLLQRVDIGAQAELDGRRDGE